MRVAVLGASGRVGRIVVQQLLASDYDVVALAHKSNVGSSSRVQVIVGDIHKPQDIHKVLEGCDIVISALGSWGTDSKDILSSAMKNIVTVAGELGIKKIISLTGSDARVEGDSIDLVHRLSHRLLNMVGGRVLRDGEKHIKILQDSSLKWVVIRSPRMTNQSSKKYRLSSSRPKPWASVSRAAVAGALVAQIENDEWHNKAPFIARVSA